MSYDTTNFALQVAYPDNIMLLDDRDMPSIYVRYPFANCKDLVTSASADDSVHPAFKINGEQINEIMVGKFPGVSHDDRIYSLPATVATAYINHDQYVTRCRAKGKGHHCITAAEWAFLALNAKKHKKQPKGNNNFGKDIGETEYVALRGTQDSGVNLGKTAQVLTGTGPDTWFDNGTKSGVWGLNGNIWEWVSGIRLVKGELQLIPYNNAALDTIDMGDKSVEWKAINGAATGWDNIYMDPAADSAKSASIKLDWVTSHWQWQQSEIKSALDQSRNCAFKDTTIDEGVSDFCKAFLAIMALAPDTKAEDKDYTGNFWANNLAAERCAIRGASWYYGASAGVFALDLSRPRSDSSGDIGGRPAFANWVQ